MLTKRLGKALLIALFLLIPFGCEDLDTFVDCGECYAQKPSVAALTVKFTINGENPGVRYILYRGSYDTGDTLAVDTARSTEVVWDLSTEAYYSVKAEYAQGARTIFAVDGSKLRTKLDRSSCDRECYVVLGNRLDVRLKY